MNCRTIEELLSGFVDNELSQNERETVEHHLETCRNCKQSFLELQDMRSMFVTSFESIVAPAWVEENVLRAIDVKHQSMQARRLSILYLVVVLTEVGAIVSLAILPFGKFITAIVQLLLASLRGAVHLATFMGSPWLSAFVIFCVLLTGSALIGLVRLLRATNEVLL